MNLAVRQWQGLGTIIGVAVVDPLDLDRAVALVQRAVNDVDAACSRFRRDSELSIFLCDGIPHEASPLLIDLIGTALRANALTNGLVDPTVGTAMNALGYDRDFDAIRDGGAILQESAGSPGASAITLDVQAGTLAIAPGTHVDLGATAKARLADLAADTCMASGVTGVLVNCGGDIAVSGSPPPEGWSVRVTDDCAGGPGPVIRVHDGGLATSSTTVRRWMAGGRQVHHIVNPKTGLPTDGPFRTVSVAAATCVDANIATTAAIVLGTKAPAWLESKGLPARLVTNDDSVVLIGAWPADEAVAV
jgi:thiamine biosynthesis lipoprotein ApbE